MAETTRRQVLRAAATLAVVPGALTACAEQMGKDTGLGETDDPDGTDVPGDSDADTDALVQDTAPPPPPEIDFDPLTVPVDDVVFEGALQVGSVRKRRAILLTEVDWEQEVLVRVWLPGSGPGTVRLAFEEVVPRGEGGYTRVEAIGLEPGQVHEYAWFTIDGSGRLQSRTAIGRFRTPPEDDALEPFTVALGACNGGATGRNDAMGRLADVDVDMLLHLGDIVYADGSRDLDDYRTSWREWMHSDGYKAGLSSTSWLATWDDHELDNDWDPEDTSQSQKDAAAQAFYENVPMEKGPEGQLWQSYRWGKTAEILVMDCRSERLPSTRGDTDTYISRAQMDWVKDRLKNSDCVFKIVMNSVPITNMPAIWDVAANDRWEGYPSQRRELLDWIVDEAIEDVWFVSGDFHVCFCGRITRNAEVPLGKIYEVAVTMGNSNPLGLALQRPQFLYNTLSARLTTMRFDPQTKRVKVTFIDPATMEVDAELDLKQGEA